MVGGETSLMGGWGSGRPRRRSDVTELLQVTMGNVQAHLHDHRQSVPRLMNGSRVACEAVGLRGMR